MATLPKIPATPVGQQVQPVFPLPDPMQREKMMQPDQKPMQAVINTGEEVIPADVVNLLGGSKGLTDILNSVLATKGVKLSGDKGRAGAGPSAGPEMPIMACGTVGHITPNYAAGTVGATSPANAQQQPLQPPQPAGVPTPPPVASGAPTPPNLSVTSTFQQPGSFQVPGIQTSTTGVNDQVLTAAQNKAIGGAQTQTLGMTSGLTQQMLRNPQGALGSPQQQFQTGMEQYDYNQARALEAAQQQLAPVWNTGAGADKYIDLATRGAIDRTATQRNLEKSLNDESLGNIYKAIQAGRDTSEQERKGYETDVGALVDVRGVAEGAENRNFEAQRTAVDNQMKLAMQSNDINQRNAAITAQLALDKYKTDAGMQLTREESALSRAFELTLQSNDIQAQDNLMRLKGMIDEGLLIKGQEFQAIQADLQRQQDLLLQANDFVGAEKIERIKQEFAAVEADKARQFTTAERVATQSWSSSERMSAQDFELGRMYYDSELQEARAQNDFTREQQLLESQQLHELKMQTNEMDYGQKMAYLQYNLDEARADNDVGRQQTLLTFQHGQEMERLASEQGFEAAMQYNQFEYQKALSQQDFVQAEVLQRQSLEFQANENLQNRMIEYAKIQLQERGLDMEVFNQIQTEVEAGRLDPQNAVSYLQQQLDQQGIGLNLNAVDAQEQMKTALKAEYDSMRYQYGLTHPEMLDGQGKLTADGEVAFSSWYNEQTYGEAATIAEIVANTQNMIGSASPDSPLHEEYQQLLDSATPMSWGQVTKNPSGFSNNYIAFKNATPDVGSSFVGDNGTLYVVTAGAAIEDARPQDYEYFTARDVNTGKVVRVYPKGIGKGPEQ